MIAAWVAARAGAKFVRDAGEKETVDYIPPEIEYTNYRIIIEKSYKKGSCPIETPPQRWVCEGVSLRGSGSDRALLGSLSKKMQEKLDEIIGGD